MNFLKRLFSKNKTRTITLHLDSRMPESGKGIVEILTLQSDHDRNEWDEGWNDGVTDAKEGKGMCRTLNFPVHPYARGYFEGYRSVPTPNQ